jgi:hypothetical protein
MTAHLSRGPGWLVLVLAMALSGVSLSCSETPDLLTSSTAGPAITTATTTTTTGVEPATAPESGVLEPITGYGDFSGADYWDVNPVEVIELATRCVNDQGFAVTVVPPGDGISFDGVAPDQNALAAATLEACLEGLHLPNPTPPSREVAQRLYDKKLEVKACLEEQGYAIDTPPSFETYFETWGTVNWDPFESIVGLVDQEEWTRLGMVCPRT